MKKILPILIALLMVCSALPALAIVDDHNKVFDQFPYQNNIGTTTMITGGSSGTGGEGTTPTDPQGPFIKCKWEYDMRVDSHQYNTDPNYQCHCWEHDACPWIDHLQVAPVLFGEATVRFYAVVTTNSGLPSMDPLSQGYIQVFEDIWHPDGKYKYEIELVPYDEATAVSEWDHVVLYHDDLIMWNQTWTMKFTGGEDDYIGDVYDELQEGTALLYYVEATLSYCQPGGHYYVGATAFDIHGNQAGYLFNSFWYIPTSAAEIDFTQIDYSPVTRGLDKIAYNGGDPVFGTPKPTVRNIGNTPLYLMVNQTDMGFGKLIDGTPNVWFGARMGNGDDMVTYYPDTCTRITKVLPLCTADKLDFLIHVSKGQPGGPYTGSMKLYACIDWSSYTWTTPSSFDHPANVPQWVPYLYPGPMDPWGDGTTLTT